MANKDVLRNTSRYVYVPRIFFALLVMQFVLSMYILYLMYFDAPYYSEWPLVNIITYCSCTSTCVGNCYILAGYIVPGLAVPHLTLFFVMYSLLSSLITTGFTVVHYNINKMYEHVTTEEEFLLGDKAGAVYREWRLRTMIPSLCWSAALSGCMSVIGVLVLMIFGTCFNHWRVRTGRSERQQWIELREV